MSMIIFIFLLIECWALSFMSTYFKIILSDFKGDYDNIISCYSKLNQWVILEVIVHIMVNVAMLFQCAVYLPLQRLHHLEYVSVQ
uniref:Uncharacterized protein n=1 Tax=Vombatus ursinus TaxID=29139 RepID=A0A4X2L3X3_VOMUR